jgi:hypothetical protein
MKTLRISTDIEKQIKIKQMKKVSMIVLLTMLTSSAIFAQTTIDLIPSGGYTFSDRTNLGGGYFGRVDGAGNYGASLMFNVNRRFGIELLYDHMGTTTGVYTYGDGSPQSLGNLSINYAMLGLVPYLGDPNAPVRPFLGALIGAGIFSPGVYASSSDAKFTLGAEFGVDMYVTPRFGFRLKAQVLSPIDNGSGYYTGTDGASNTYANLDLYQFSLNAGIIIGLGRVLPVEHRRTMYRRPRPRYYGPAPYPYY